MHNRHRPACGHRESARCFQSVRRQGSLPFVDKACSLQAEFWRENVSIGTRPAGHLSNGPQSVPSAAESMYRDNQFAPSGMWVGGARGKVAIAYPLARSQGQVDAGDVTRPRRVPQSFATSCAKRWLTKWKPHAWRRRKACRSRRLFWRLCEICQFPREPR
jgi:hypothetical protein